MIERNCASNIYFTVPSDCSSQLTLEEPDDSAKGSQNRRSFAVRWRVVDRTPEARRPAHYS